MKIKVNSNITEFERDQPRHSNLTPNKTYSVIGIEFECYRIVNDDFEPILYPKELFEIIDPSYPNSWVRTELDDGEYYIEPLEFSEIGFFEDYFEGSAEAIGIYKSYLENSELKDK
mgnify:CR=1 FL=1